MFPLLFLNLTLECGLFFERLFFFGLLLHPRLDICCFLALMSNFTVLIQELSLPRLPFIVWPGTIMLYTQESRQINQMVSQTENSHLTPLVEWTLLWLITVRKTHVSEWPTVRSVAGTVLPFTGTHNNAMGFLRSWCTCIHFWFSPKNWRHNKMALNGSANVDTCFLPNDFLFFLCWLMQKKVCSFVLVRLLTSVIHFGKRRIRIWLITNQIITEIAQNRKAFGLNVAHRQKIRLLFFNPSWSVKCIRYITLSTSY